MGASMIVNCRRTRRVAACRVKGWAAIVSVMVFTGALASCATEQADAVDPVFAELIETAIEDAEAGGAGAQQLVILEEARELGEVTLEQMRESTRATVACFVDVGFDSEYFESTRADGLPLPDYSVSLHGEWSDSDIQVMDQCDFENGFWVNKVYQIQPSSDQLWLEFINGKAGELRSCLEDAGYETDPDATGAELANQAGAVAAETQGDVDCMQRVGAV